MKIDLFSAEEKLKFIIFLQHYINDNVSKINLQMKQINESLQNETKSSAGDKFETAREMVTQEINKLGNQLTIYKSHQKQLEIISGKTNIAIGIGALFCTAQGLYFIGISLGKVVYGNFQIMVVSDDAPFAKIFKGKKANDEVVFNERRHIIYWVC